MVTKLSIGKIFILSFAKFTTTKNGWIARKRNLLFFGPKFYPFWIGKHFLLFISDFKDNLRGEKKYKISQKLQWLPNIKMSYVI